MTLFKPVIRLKIDASQKTYTMYATVVVPNGCYTAAGAVLGIPDGETVTPETQGAVLNIARHEGPCIQALQVLRFKISGIPLSEGKSMLVGFAVVDDKVVGVGGQRIPEPEKAFSMLAPASAPASDPTGVRIQSVNAWINAMPPGPPKVIAIVNVFAPCINYSFDFETKGSFGFTGRTLLVELKARLPGACLKAIFEGPIRYEEDLTDADQFDSIAVAFEGELHFDALEITV